MSTSSRGNVDHVHAVEQAVEMVDISGDVSLSPANIQHETNRADDKPGSRLYPSLPREPSGVTLAEKPDTKPSNNQGHPTRVSC